MKPHKDHDFSFHHLLRGIILIGFMLLLFKLLLTNNISLLIAPKMIHFIYFTLFVCLILGVLLIIRGTSGKDHSNHCDCDGDHSYPTSFSKNLFLYLLFIIPITTGFLFSNNVLDSSVAMNRTIKLGASSQAANQVNTVKSKPKSNSSSDLSKTNSSSNTTSVFDNQPEPLTQSEYNALKDKLLKAKMINIDDVQYVNIMNIIQDNLKNMIGKTVTTKGFVYREKEFMQNQIIVARFGITCCVADASVYGMMVKGDVAVLPKDKWVQVTGKIEQTQFNGEDIPVLKIDQLSKITPPKQPYVFDVGIKIE
ncbi:TIGR03943 family protein [Bacillus sp. AFS076308]|uniref:TIGR03943 family putative permease subunit n=2 Tax=unclassified Bacillus (in: firmicutes) TaxID=185979 RepID=UPI000BF968D4|nr:TIGR03943 family protein [Bacillus sp. AFS037270]PFO09664.1 TIGR03943 family protein [Bacillus sp. AFS076308]PGV54858.1 TIGR03943 family protein [Bacillus sp. AFS037270]